MARDHFIPATFLGRFSPDEQSPGRKRQLQVLRPGFSGPRTVTAENIGFAHDLYNVHFDESVTPDAARFVDVLWDDYEPVLPEALDNLAEGRVSLEAWITIVVPFIASLLVRDRHFGHRLTTAYLNNPDAKKWVDTDVFSPSNLNLNRIIRRNGLMGRLLVSQWTLIDTAGDLCTSDLGYAYYSDQAHHAGTIIERACLIVPIAKRQALYIAPEPSVQVLMWEDERWGRQIGHGTADQLTTSTLNSLIAAWAQDFVAGSEKAIGFIDPAGIRQATPDQLQRTEELWPFRLKTTELAGIWGPLACAGPGITPKELGMLYLEPRAGILERLNPEVLVADPFNPRHGQRLRDVLPPSEDGFAFRW